MKTITLTLMGVIVGGMAWAQTTPSTRTTTSNNNRNSAAIKTAKPGTASSNETPPSQLPHIYNSNTSAPVTAPVNTPSDPSSNPSPSITTGTTNPTSAPVAPQTTGSLSNTNITTRIRQDLMNDPRVSDLASRITVEYLNGQITLRGQVPSREDEADLLTRVRTSSGSSNINNQLTIAPTQNHF